MRDVFARDNAHCSEVIRANDSMTEQRQKQDSTFSSHGFISGWSVCTRGVHMTLYIMYVHEREKERERERERLKK